MRYIVVPIRAVVQPDQGFPDRRSTGPPVVSGTPRSPDEPLDDLPHHPEDALARWVAAARTSLDACLVVDAGGTVAGLSPTAADLLGTSPAGIIGRPLDEVLNLVDFGDTALEARGAARRIPPLIAVRENSLSRGMMRLRLADGERRMLDVVAAPIHDDDANPVGAVSFLASV